MSILTSPNQSVGAGSPSWQSFLKSAIRDSQELLERLNLPPKADFQAQATQLFPVFVPLPYFSRIQAGDIHDPLLCQVLPQAAEDLTVPGFSHDPLQESDAIRQPGLLQKYEGRVLLVTTGACAIHCRYCFRRHFPYQETPHSDQQWEPALEEIAGDPSISEVILSGGDPLMLADPPFRRLVQSLSAIKHVRRLRLHTRLPIMIPQRINDEILESLSLFRSTDSQRRIVMVIHSNHANELDSHVAAALSRLARHEVTLLNQSVLLKGINDNPETLMALSNRLFESGVLPYYLHQMDQVAGASHFVVPLEQGHSIMASLRAKSPGYLVPRFVQEIAGEASKTPL